VKKNQDIVILLFNIEGADGVIVLDAEEIRYD